MKPIEAITSLARKGGGILIKNSPALLAAAAAAGVILTGVMLIKATRAAEDDIREAEDLLAQAEEKGRNEDPQVTKEMKKKIIFNLIKKLAPKYAFALISAIMTLLCIFGCQSINHRRQAALATMYSVTENTLRSYEAKVKEMVGEKKNVAIKDAIAKDRIDQNPVNDKTVIVTGNGEVLCFDNMSGQYFHSDPETIRRTVNNLNERLLTEMFISLNEFYYELGLKQTKLGGEMGWNINTGLIEVRFSSHLNENNEPVLDLDYTIEPRFDYRNLH